MPPTTPFFERDGIQVLLGDSREAVAGLATGSFQTCITSPPYWGLRDYDFPNQIGAELRVEDYIADLVSLFREVRRSLRDDGTLWLNIGDAYTSGGSNLARPG